MGLQKTWDISESVDVEPAERAGALRHEKAPTNRYCACSSPGCDICHS